MSLRSKVIRLASSLPPGPNRNALLRVLTGASKHLPLTGIIAGYQEGEGRELNMLGPFVTAAKWYDTMKKALEWSEGGYNNFEVKKAAAMLKRMEKADPTLTFAPGREGSPVLYVSGSREALLKVWPIAKRSGADEIHLAANPTPHGPFFNPKSPDLPEQAFLRLWWD
jgi:hypothetical protein